jgi:hypothetical protein
MIAGRCLEPGEQRSPPSDDLGAGEHLDRHAQRVADGQSPQSARGTVESGIRLVGRSGHGHRAPTL